MKITTLPILGVLSFALAGCIARDNTCDCDKSSSSDAASESSVAVSSSSAPVVTSSSEVIVSSSSEAVVSSSAAPISSSSVMSSSSAPVVIISSSSVESSSSVVSSSSAAPVSSSSAAPVSSSSVASSSAPAVNIEDLTFSATLTEDQSVDTDSLANLGSILLGLIDKDAFDEFYLGLVAQGLNEAAINKALSVMGPIGSALGADFVYEASQMELLPRSETIIFAPSVRKANLGFFGEEYYYQLEQTIDDVAVKLDLVLRFPDNQVAFSPSSNTYTVNLDSLQVVVNEFSLTTSEVEIALDTTNPVIFSAQRLRPQIVLTADGANIVSVTAVGQNLSVDLKGTLVNGIIGATAEGAGTIGGLNAAINMETGSSTVGILTPNINVNMQGVDTQN